MGGLYVAATLQAPLTACGPETVSPFRPASQGPPLLDRHIDARRHERQ